MWVLLNMNTILEHMQSHSTGVDVGECGFNDIPRVHQRRILEMVDIPLRKMAQLACLSRDMHALYLERVQERDAHVAALLELHFDGSFWRELSPAQMALPRDLVVDLLVRLSLMSFLMYSFFRGSGSHFATRPTIAETCPLSWTSEMLRDCFED
jgi:hypothetical protein